MILTFVGAFVLAYACLKLYDEPVRKWLTNRFLKGVRKSKINTSGDIKKTGNFSQKEVARLD